MLQDNTLIFAEGHADVAASSIIDLDGTALARAFVFCTLPANLSAVAITLSLGDAKASASAITALESHTFNASAVDLARGIMFFPLPTNAYKYAQVAIDITASADLPKDFVCGITDAPTNIDVHVKA